MSAQAAIEFIKQCSNKVAEVPGESQMTTVVARSMNGLVAMIQNQVFDEDRNMRCQLETMQKLRGVAMKYDDKITSDPTRIFHYTMSECIEKVMEVFLAKKDVVVGVSAEEPVAQQRQVVDRANQTAIAAVEEPVIQRAHFDEPDMLSIKEEVDDLYMANQQAANCASDRTDAMLDEAEQATPQQSSVVSTPTPMRGMSAVKTLVCRTCKKSNMNISSFVRHLSDIHGTTPVLERIAFECGCGHVATNYNGCDARSLNVIDRAY